MGKYLKGYGCSLFEYTYLPRKSEWNHKENQSWNSASWLRFKTCVFWMQTSCHCYTSLLCCTIFNKGLILLVQMSARVSVGDIWETILSNKMPANSEKDMSFSTETSTIGISIGFTTWTLFISLFRLLLRGRTCLQGRKLHSLHYRLRFSFLFILEARTQEAIEQNFV